MTAPATRPEPAGGEAAARGYIVGPGYDWLFFLLPPLFSLALGWAVSGTRIADGRFWLGGRRFTVAGLVVGALTSAHLVAVFYRSHAHPGVFPRHRFRFLALPALAFAAMMTSAWAVCVVTVLVTFWDVYHSALQTFGFARIYDRNAGNDPRTGRWWDFGLNVLLYVGPVVAGACMLPHFQRFDVFEEVQAAGLASIPARMQAHHGTLARVVLGLGALYVAAYVVAQVALHRAGRHKLCLPKVFLVSSTGLVSIWAWGFNAWGQAFLIMNLFHAIQYLALVWWSEGRRLGRTLRLDRSRARRALFACLFFGAVLAYGLWAELVPDSDRARWSIVQTVALMHFFYDGFIWSVRKRAI
jgi:hypothetical protein